MRKIWTFILLRDYKVLLSERVTDSRGFPFTAREKKNLKLLFTINFYDFGVNSYESFQNCLNFKNARLNKKTITQWTQLFNLCMSFYYCLF